VGGPGDSADDRVRRRGCDDPAARAPRQVSTFLTSLDYQPPSLEALVEVLFGDYEPVGKLPVTVAEPGGGKTLFPFGFSIGLTGATG